MQVKKQKLELDMEQQTGSKWEKEYVKAVGSLLFSPGSCCEQVFVVPSKSLFKGYSALWTMTGIESVFVSMLQIKSSLLLLLLVE